MEKDLEYMKIAYQEALKAIDDDEVPIGAIIVKNDEIIAKAYNQRETHQIATHHAETLVIERACKELKSWRLDGCTLYCTLEPCLMCTGSIINSRIDRVVYGAKELRWLALEKIIKNEETVLNHIPEITGGIYGEECSNIIKNYFKRKR